MHTFEVLVMNYCIARDEYDVMNIRLFYRFFYVGYIRDKYISIIDLETLYF